LVAKVEKRKRGIFWTVHDVLIVIIALLMQGLGIIYAIRI